MPDIHPIRLRGPWEIEPLWRSIRQSDGSLAQSTANLPPPARQQMPADWSASLGEDFRGRVRYRRRFGCPSALEPHETVWLVIETVDPRGQVSLAGQPLGTADGKAGSARFEITSLLGERNELVIEVELLAEPLPTQPNSSDDLPRLPGRNGQPGGLIGEVRLEIRN